MTITEREAEVAIDIQLSSCGWQLNPNKANRNVYKQQARTPEQNKDLKPKSPDYVLYAYEDSDKPTVVIEAKRPGKSMSNALQDGKDKYARKIKAPIVIASDGWRVKTWHMEKNEPLFVDGREVDELFSPEMARYFASDNNFSSFSKNVAISQDELIRKFKKANDVIKNEGFTAGIDRFSEFANLMFLKLKIEGGGEEIAGFSWEDIETKQGQSLLKAVRNMFVELKREHSRLFEQTRIQSPKKYGALD